MTDDEGIHKVKIVAAFMGLKFLPRVFALAYNNFNPKLRLSAEGVEYRAFILTGRFSYEDIELVDILLWTRTTNVYFIRSNSVFTISANTNDEQELYRCLQYLAGKGCLFSKRAQDFCLSINSKTRII